MKKEYRLVSENKLGYKHYELLKCSSSVDYWLKKAKLDEKDGCYVEMQFEYYSDLKEVYLTKYMSFHKKTNFRTTIRLIKTSRK